MAELKNTIVNGVLLVNGELIASTIKKRGGSAGQILFADGGVKTLDELKTALGLGGAAYKAEDYYQPKDADLTAIAGLTGTSGLLKKTEANKWELDTSAYVTSSGVTSVTAGTGLSGNTITTTGTIGLADNYGDTKNPYASKTKNYVLAAPNGSNGAPTFRALVEADIPSLASSKITGLATVATSGKYSDLSGLPTITDEKVTTSKRGTTDTHYLTGTSGNTTGGLKYDDNIKFGTTVGELHMKICNLNTAEAPARLSYDSTYQAIKFTFA